MDYNLFIQIFLSVVFIFHNFVILKLVLFSRSISFFPIFNRLIEKLQKVTYRSHTNPPPPPPLTRTTVRCPLTREREGGVRRGLVGTLAGGVDGGLHVGGGVDLRSWYKMLFLGIFWKITTYWSPLDERVRSSFAESCRN